MASEHDVSLRQMTVSDLDRGVQLCRLAGWNQQRADWELFLRCNPQGCFVAVVEEEVVGTVTTIDYGGRSSWVGMVLVDPNRRRMGIGTRLLAGAIDSLAECRCVKLDATPAGKKLYDTLGFVDELRLSRQTIETLPGELAPEPGVVPLGEADLSAVIALDAAAFGVPRPLVIEGLFRMAPDRAFGLWEQGQLRGFVLGRPGETFAQIGPLCCWSTQAARRLATAAFGGLAGQSVVIDVPLHDHDWLNWLAELGFREQRPFIRMVKGENLPGRPELRFAISGPELG